MSKHIFTFAFGSQSMNTMVMTHTAQNTDANLPAYWHNLHFVALNEDGCVHCIKAQIE